MIDVNIRGTHQSIISVDLQDEGDQVVECRVRYLSFLGIGQNIRQCAFIMHTTQDLFIAHVFECDPSAATLCKTIEAACKVCQMIIKQILYLL